MSPSGTKPTILEIKKAVADFLKSTLDDVHEVHVTKMALIGPEEGIWEAEAEVFIVNATIKALGLPVSKPVLDREIYQVQLNGDLGIIAYAPKEAGEGEN